MLGCSPNRFRQRPRRWLGRPYPPSGQGRKIITTIAGLGHKFFTPDSFNYIGHQTIGARDRVLSRTRNEKAGMKKEGFGRWLRGLGQRPDVWRTGWDSNPRYACTYA